MNAKQMRMAHDEYERFEGVPRGVITTGLWDHAHNRRRIVECVLIDLGRRPAVPPAELSREDKELATLRGNARVLSSTQSGNGLPERLRTWLKGVGSATHHQAAQAMHIHEAHAKYILANHPCLFKVWKKIAGQTYYVAV